MILNTNSQPIKREVFIANNKNLMLADLDILSYGEFITKWSSNITGIHSRVFDKWMESPITNWKFAIKNAIILSTIGMNNSQIARAAGVHTNTVYQIKLGRLYTGDEVLIKLEEALGITLYKR